VREHLRKQFIRQLREGGIWRIYGRQLSGTGVPQGDDLVIVSASSYDNILPSVAEVAALDAAAWFTCTSTAARDDSASDLRRDQHLFA